MEDVLENIVSQVGILDNEENPATDSDRVKTPVVGADSTDFGGSQNHDVANQASTEGVDRLTPTASQKKSEEVEAPNHEKKWNKELTSLEKQIGALTAFMAPKGNIHKEIKKMTDGIKITHSRLKKLNSGFLEMTTAPMKTNEQQTTPSRVKDDVSRRCKLKVARLMVHPANGRRSLLYNLRTKGRGKPREG